MPSQRYTLGIIETHSKKLYRGYLLKEALRDVFKEPILDRALWELNHWLTWATNSRLKPFVKLARNIRKRHRESIDNVLKHGLSNARIEAANTKLRLLTRVAYGFHSPGPLISLALLKLSGLCPPLPGLT